MSGPVRVPPGRHPNWCRCGGCRRDIREFESRQFRGTVIAAGVAVAAGLAIAAGRALAHAWHGRALLALAAAGLLALVILAARFTARWDRTAREQEERLGALDDRAPGLLSPMKPPPPSVCVQPPACRHPRAVPVEDVTGERVAWLCPAPPEGCGAQLDPGAVSAELSPHAGWPPVRKAGR